MSKKQHSKIGNQVITLDYTGSKSLTAKASQPISYDPSTTLFVKQLNYSTTVDSLKAAFNKSTDVKLATFPNTGKSRGYAFISYQSTEDADADRQRLDGSQLDERSIVVGFALTPEQKAANQAKGKKNKKMNKKKSGDKKTESTNKSSKASLDSSEMEVESSPHETKQKDKKKKKAATVASGKEGKQETKVQGQSAKKRKENGSCGTPNKKKLKL